MARSVCLALHPLQRKAANRLPRSALPLGLVGPVSSERKYNVPDAFSAGAVRWMAKTRVLLLYWGADELAPRHRAGRSGSWVMIAPTADGTSMTETPRERRTHDIVTAASLCVVTLLAVGYILPLLVRDTYRFQIMYNEGWVVYHAQDIAEKRPLYGQISEYNIVNYPPLSFYVIHAAAGLTGNPLYAGRAVSALSLLATSILLGGVVFAASRSWPAALLGTLLALVFIARYAPDYIGSNDPQLLAHAVQMAAVLLFVRASSSRVAAVSAALVATALFIKHSLFAFPVAIMISLWTQNRRRFAVWTATLLLTALVWTAFSMYAQGPHFFSSLLSPRVFKNVRAPLAFMILLSVIEMPFAVALVWLLVDRTFPHWKLFCASLCAAVAYGLYVSRGDGAWVNHWFDAILAISMIVPLAWSRAEEFWLNAGWPRRWVLALFPVLLTLGPASQEVLPRRLMDFRALRQEWAGAESRFSSDIEYERMHSGPAICEDLSLCAFAAKDLEYEPFNARQKILRDPAAAAKIVHDLREHRFQTIQLNAPPDETITAADRALFPAEFMQELLANYHVDRRTSERVFFVPNAAPAPPA